MTHNALIPEAPLLVYPTLAATIGLEEATMLSALTQFARAGGSTARNGYHWFELNQATAEQLLPFWAAMDIQRICTNLREQGLLLLASAPFSQSGLLKFAFNERTEQASAPTQAQTAAPAPQPPAQPAQPAAKKTIANRWSPDQDTLTRLAQLCIPARFAMDQVPEFVNYWRERGEPAHAWGSKFMQHVIRKWRDFEAQEYQRAKNSPMHRDWQPSEDALNVLVHHAGINRSFVEDAVPEFVLYWREQGGLSDNWNKKFRDHVQRQWVRYRAALEHDPTPRRIAENWQPSEDVFEVLRLANIDLNFARALLPEFVIYWRDSNQVHTSWNTRFLQFVKQRWSQRGNAPVAGASQSPAKDTRNLSLAEQLTDRSWAL